MKTMLIGDKLMSVAVEATGNMTISFQRMGMASGNYMPWGNLEVRGFINDCFRDGKHSMQDITVYDLASATLTNSFSDSINMAMRKVYLGYGTNNSFQNCQNVYFESLDMNESISQGGNSWFMNGNNLSIKKLGSTVARDGLADGPTNKFAGGTGNFYFKIGYNTINAGGIEGDVAEIIGTGTPATISYTL